MVDPPVCAVLLSAFQPIVKVVDVADVSESVGATVGTTAIVLPDELGDEKPLTPRAFVALIVACTRSVIA